jgi:hypothetical protein
VLSVDIMNQYLVLSLIECTYNEEIMLLKAYNYPNGTLKYIHNAAGVDCPLL